MGGVLPFTQPIMPRLVAKFGTAPTTFSPSTTPAANLPPAIDNYSPTEMQRIFGPFFVYLRERIWASNWAGVW